MITAGLCWSSSMIPKSCRLFGQDHALARIHGPEKLQTFRTRSCASQNTWSRKVADFSDKIMRQSEYMIPKGCRLFGQDHALAGIHDPERLQTIRANTIRSIRMK